MSSSSDARADTTSQEAADWCILMHAPDCTDESRAAFRRWYAASPANKAEYDAIENIWFDAMALPPVLTARPTAPLVQPDRRPRRREKALRFARTAVPATVLIGLAWMAGWSTGLLPGRVAYYPAGGTMQTVSLPDGSTVELNRHSGLLYASFRTHRRVRLTAGEAYFTVAHDVESPFVVSTETGSVEATGTRFNIWTDPQRLIVTLTEGGVLVHAGDREPVALTPGTQASFLRSGQRLTVGAVDPAVALAWREGKLVLNDLPLEAALPLVNRYLAEPLRLGDPRLGSLRIAGIYDVSQLPNLPASLAQMLPLRSRSDNGEVVLLPR